MKFEITREILIKKEDETDPSYGCDPEERPLREHIQKGIVNIDKPAGPTSHQVVSWVKEILNVKKAGHSGTLDPKVTGVLPVALEDSTRIIKYLLSAGKEYVCVMTLHDEVPDNRLNEVFEYFQGEIYQKPPLKSSVKRELRKKKVYYIKRLEREDNCILFRVGCEAGTYIRKLCHDMGLVLGTGAHMQELRRTKVGPLDETSIVSLQDLKDGYEFYKESGEEKYLRDCIMPMERSIQHLKKIWIKDGAVDAICHGANLNAPGVSKMENGIQCNELTAVLSLKDELVAIGKSLKTSEEILEMDTGTVVDLERVVMDKGTYPKKWHTA